jgi:hypothetical protein
VTITDRGLVLTNQDATSAEEIDTFRAIYAESHGEALPAYDFWLEWSPDVLKRHRMQAYAGGHGSGWFPLIYLHYYAVIGFEDGIAYELSNAIHGGVTRGQVLEALATAFIHSGPFGMRYVAAASKGLLETAPDEGFRPGLFPDGWEPDRDAFKSGLDFSTVELSAAERRSLLEWYERTLGEVPRYVRFLLDANPRLLKAHRGRFENAVGTALPKQMMPLLLLHLNVSRGFGDGVREAVQLARAFKVGRERTLWTIGWGMLNGGTAAVSMVDRVAGDVLESFED